MRTTDYSCDIETFGTAPYSVVTSIGITPFNRFTGEIGDTIYLRIDPNDCVRLGLRLDPSTVMWWLNQSDEARKEMTAGGGSVEYTLARLDSFFKSTGFGKDSKVWGNGSGFDVNLLENLYAVAGQKVPWDFWQARDMRTVVDIAQVKVKTDFTREGTHHNAGDDAEFQAKVIMFCINKLTRKDTDHA